MTPKELLALWDETVAKLESRLLRLDKLSDEDWEDFDDAFELLSRYGMIEPFMVAYGF